MAPDATTPPDEGRNGETTPTGGRTAGELREVADGLRSRIDLFGKALAAIATLGTTALGLSESRDLFPADGNGEWALAACVALAIAALAAIWIAVRLMMVAGPAFVSADASSDDDIDADERTDELEPIFKAAAGRFGYTSLAGLQERERSMREAATQTADEAERARRTALADEAKTEIEQALARGQVAVVRRRAKNAVSDPLSWVLYLAVITGLIVFAAATNWVSSEREDLVANAKACGDARKAGATAGELGRTETCDKEAEAPDPKPKPLSAAEARAELTAKLATLLQACTALVSNDGSTTGRPLADDECDPLREALTAINAFP